MHLPKANALFPFDRSGRFRSKIVKNSVDSVNLGDDTARDLVKNLVRNLLDSCGHSILGIYGADDCGPTHVTAVISDTNALDIGDNNEILPYLFCKTGLIEFVTKNSVCLAQCMQTVARDCTKATNAKTRAREGLTVNHGVGQTKCFANDTDFVLEEEFDGLYKLKVQILGQTAYVVVGLYCLLALGGLDGLKNVGLTSV